MEVYSHTHSPRKKWTHYFWEFLMLFLAVFCGFLAEYQLEHKIEREKGKQYMHSFYDDLKADSSHISRLIHVFENKIVSLANKDKCFEQVMGKDRSTECLLDLFMNSEGFSDFVYTDRTLQQLKNAGGFACSNKLMQIAFWSTIRSSGFMLNQKRLLCRKCKQIFATRCTHL